MVYANAENVAREQLLGFVKELIDIAGEYVAAEPYLAHKYNFVGDLARIQAHLDGVEPFLPCPDDCSDCARRPQLLEPPFSDEILVAHVRAFDDVVATKDGPRFVTSCSCGANLGTSTLNASNENYRAHLRSLATGTGEPS